MAQRSRGRQWQSRVRTQVSSSSAEGSLDCMLLMAEVRKRGVPEAATGVLMTELESEATHAKMRPSKVGYLGVY